MSLCFWKNTGVVLANSPTAQVGYEAVNELPKEAHESPMLSLDKTKERESLREFVGEHKTLLSWKLDGLTIVLTYENGDASKSGYPGKRRSGGSDHQQCPCISEHSASDRF